MVTLLERLSVQHAMRLAYGHRITVTTKYGSIEEYQLLRYSGYSDRVGRHAFLVRDTAGSLHVMTDYQMGLVGDHAVGRLGEPERLAVNDVFRAAS